MLPLDKLEMRSEVRGTLDLLDEKGRKPVGGKMEVVARLREPFSGITLSPLTLTHPHALTHTTSTGKDTQEKEEQWLVFQEAIAVTSSKQMPRPSPAGSAPSPNLSLLSPMKVENTTSAEALKVGSKVDHTTRMLMYIAMVTGRVEPGSKCTEVRP